MVSPKLWGVVVVMLWAAVAHAAPVQPQRHALVISVDGLKPDYLLDPRYRHLKLPTLRRLLAEGSHARALQPVLPPVTYPNHTTMVTGVRPMGHGISGNRRNDWNGAHGGEWFWYAREIAAYTIWDAVRDAGGTVATLEWPVTVGANVDYNVPQYWRYGYPDDLRLLTSLCTPPGLLSRGQSPEQPDPGAARTVGTPAAHSVPKNEEVVRPDSVEAALTYDGLIARCASSLLDEKQPTLVMVGLASLDDAQHEHGVGSPQAQATLERLDTLIGTMVERARSRATARYAVVVLSDHGFAPVSKGLNVGVLLKKEGLDAEVLSSPVCGFNPFYLRKAARPGARERLQALLERVVADRSLGAAHLWTRAELDAEGAFPGAVMALESQDGTMFGTSTEGPVVTTRPEKASHGYHPKRPDQQAFLMLAGEGIRPGVVLPQVRMIDVAPTLAALLGVPFSPREKGRRPATPTVEGRALREFLADDAPGAPGQGTPQSPRLPETRAKGSRR